MANSKKIPSRTQVELLPLLMTERTGREVAKHFAERYKRAVPFGTLYTTLGRMEDEGWVTSRDTHGSDRRVRHFKLTGAGIRALNEANAYLSTLLGLPEGLA